jgi:hypothetical protein
MRQSQIARLMPADDTRRDSADALDIEFGRVLVVAVDAAPRGRKGMEHHSRVDKIARGESVARLSDAVRAVRGGADPADMIVALEDAIAAIRRAVPSERPNVTVVMRETSEATIALVEYAAAPTPENRRKARREVAQAKLALHRANDGLSADHYQAHENRLRALTTLRGA